MATVSNARLIIGYSSKTSLKLSTEREYRRQYVSALTLAVRRPLVKRQISARVKKNIQEGMQRKYVRGNSNPVKKILSSLFSVSLGVLGLQCGDQKLQC